MILKKHNSSKKPTKKEHKKQAWKTVLIAFLLLVWVAAVVIVAQLIVGYLMLWILGKDNFSRPVPMAIYSALSYILAFVCILYTTPKFIINKKNKTKKLQIISKNMSRNDLGLREWPTWTDIGLAPVGFIISLLLAAILVGIFSSFSWFDAEQTQEIGFSTYLIGFDRVIAFITLVLVAPVAEELIFRGWLYGKLRPMLSEKLSDRASMIISILLVSLLFGTIHMQWNVGVNVFALSIVLCGLREITGTIYSGILVHILKNGIAFYMLYVIGIR